MKSLSWAEFKAGHNLIGLNLDYSQPACIGQLRLRGVISMVEWRRYSAIAVFHVENLRLLIRGRWTKHYLFTKCIKCIVLDLDQSKSGVRVLGDRCFRWATMCGQSFIVAPTFRTLVNASKASPTIKDYQKMSRRLVKTLTAHK